MYYHKSGPIFAFFTLFVDSLTHWPVGMRTTPRNGVLDLRGDQRFQIRRFDLHRSILSACSTTVMGHKSHRLQNGRRQTCYAINLLDSFL